MPKGKDTKKSGSLGTVQKRSSFTKDMYGTAEPDPAEFKSYQSIQLKSINNLKCDKNSTKIIQQITQSQPKVHTVYLKEKNGNPNVPTPKKVMKKTVLKAPIPLKASSGSKANSLRLATVSMVTRAEVKPESQKPVAMGTRGVVRTKPDPIGHAVGVSTKSAVTTTAKPEVPAEERGDQRKPPAFPPLQICNVLPGTPEWEVYWNDFEKTVGQFSQEVEEYGSDMDELSKEDLSIYKAQLQQMTKTDILTSLTAPPLIKERIRPSTVYDVGGWMIKRVGGTGPVFVTSLDHIGFRLEIPFQDLMDEEEVWKKVRVDEGMNLMRIDLSGQNDSTVSAPNQLHIGPPVGRKIKELIVGLPLHCNGKLVISTRSH